MWKITILLCCLLGLSLSGAELLTEGGRSRYEIVLPADAVRLSRPRRGNCSHF